MPKPLVIIPVYNEADILPWVINHLLDQECEVYILDNWSTDGSYELAKTFKVTVKRWPEFPVAFYDWTGILKQIEEIALQHQNRWIIFHDADEIRRAPDEDKTLREYLDDVFLEGYNAVRYKVITFCPVDDTYKGDPEKHFKYYSTDKIDSRISQVKTWFQMDSKVDIHSTGGHEVRIPDRRIYSKPFTLKHYPIRTIEQGTKKIFVERKPRYAPSERSKQWHVQYDEIRNADHLICDPATLQRVCE